MANYAPLPHEWMLVSIIGFFVTVFEIYPLNKTWGLTLSIFFIIIFTSSVVSMSGTGLSEEEMVELAVHDRRVRAGQHRKNRKA